MMTEEFVTKESVESRIPTEAVGRLREIRRLLSFYSFTQHELRLLMQEVREINARKDDRSRNA